MVLTCRDYEWGWNELIDMEREYARRDAADADQLDSAIRGQERALLEHAADCPACRQVGARFQVLRHALLAGVRPNIPPAGFVDRTLAEIESLSPSAWAVYGEVATPLFPPSIVAFAAIAAILVAMALAVPHVNQASYDRV